MSVQIINAFPKEARSPKEFPYVEVSEFFFDTIQGENFVGYPAAFLRVQGCTLNCSWCDTESVWREGNPYGVRELVDLVIQSGLGSKLIDGQHLVITGGSPLRQQLGLTYFLEELSITLGMTPYIEIENECVIKPQKSLIIPFVSCWNNSPKLSNSGNSRVGRYKPEIIGYTAELKNSWFKFVIQSQQDVEEIYESFLQPCLIQKEQIVFMPEGQTRKEILTNAPIVAQMAVDFGVRYTNREHIILWDKKTGV